MQTYIDFVCKKRKAPFCKITIGKGFEWNSLNKLCDLTLLKETLNIAWSLIIDAIAEEYKNVKIISFIPKSVLEFLISNKICLIDLAHLRLPMGFLLKIYERDNSCWEALKTIKCYKKKNQ